MTSEGTTSSTNSGTSSSMQMGGKKSNGHKDSCMCPICKNMMMKKGKKGGSSHNMAPAHAASMPTKMMPPTKGGKRKSNGHKPDCGCPICQNMKKRGGAVTPSASHHSLAHHAAMVTPKVSKGGRRTRKNKKSKKSRSRRRRG
jgi:hypothetical protein